MAEILVQHEIADLALLKIDCEGCEYQVDAMPEAALIAGELHDPAEVFHGRTIPSAVLHKVHKLFCANPQYITGCHRVKLERTI